MNKKITIIMTLFALMTITSCDFFRGSQTANMTGYPDLNKVEEISDSLKQLIKAQDSLSQGLVAKIDTITKAINQSKEQIENLENEIKEAKAPSRILAYAAVIALLLSLVALILAIVCSNKKVDKLGVRDAARDYIEDKNTNLYRQLTRLEYDVKDLAKKIKSNNAITTPNSSDRDQAVNDKIMAEIQKRRMESQLEKPIQAPESNHSSQVPESNPSKQEAIVVEPQIIRTGYAPIHTGKYLVDVVGSKQETCVYSLSYLNKETAEFNIISLDKIKTINDLKDVIDIAQGSCLLEQASNYAVIEKGLCKKIDDSTWEVTKKLKIRVTK